jgi:hypothetical protein
LRGPAYLIVAEHSIGGLLIAGLGWRTIFLVNVPLGIVNVVLAERY